MRSAVAAFAVAGLVAACGGDVPAAPSATETDDESSSDVLVGEGGVLAVTNGTLIDGTGGAPVPDAVVVIEDGLITALGAAGDVAVPDSAEVIDAGGGTIIPGLVDTHVHHLARLRLDEGQLDGGGVALALTAPLQAGVTTYRDLGSPFDDRSDLDQLRTALDDLGPRSPTVVLSGPLLAATGNYAIDGFPGQARAVADVGEATEAVAALVDAGVDQIKLMIEDWAQFRSEPTPSLSGEQIEAIVGAAHDNGMVAVAHVSTIEAARTALDGGVDELTHWPGSEPLPDDIIRQLIERAVPVGTTFGVLMPADDDVRRLLDAGGTIVLSSDAPGVTSPLLIAGELHRMVTAGMTPMETIVASTRDAAVALELEDRIGTLAIGKEGDLVVVDGDPLREIGAVGDPVAVVNDGLVVHSTARADLAGD